MPKRSQRLIIPFLSAPYLDGYNFKGWTVNDTLYTRVDEVQETTVETLKNLKAPITVKVDYEKKTETHIVKVINGPLVDERSNKRQLSGRHGTDCDC